MIKKIIWSLIKLIVVGTVFILSLFNVDSMLLVKVGFIAIMMFIVANTILKSKLEKLESKKE